MQGFHAALASAAAGGPQPLSWQRLLAGPVAVLAGQHRLAVTQPKLDYGALEPGATAAKAIQDAAAGLAGSTAPDAFLLFLALRSWRLIVPVLLALAQGLLLTIGLAALAVGTLNLVSVASAILFVGIAVDFGIQSAERFREERLNTPSLPGALDRTARRAGRQVLVASIAGVGMVIAFACTVTVLPALLVGFQPQAGRRGGGPGMAPPARCAHRPDPQAHSAGVRAAGTAGAASPPWLAFDGDPLHQGPHDRGGAYAV